MVKKVVVDSVKTTKPSVSENCCRTQSKVCPVCNGLIEPEGQPKEWHALR